MQFFQEQNLCSSFIFRQPEALMRAALKNITCRVPPPEHTARSFVIAAA